MNEDVLVQEGITPDQVDQLLLHVQEDAHIQKHTHDLTRFASKAQFDEWIKKDRKIYTLTNSQGELLGLIWVTKKNASDIFPEVSLPEYQTTFAIRIYEKARGRKLSYFFMKEVFKKLDLDKVWLVVQNDNTIAVALYRKFGFKEVFKDDKRCLMTYERP